MLNKNIKKLIIILVLLVCALALKIYLPRFVKSESLFQQQTKNIDKDNITQIEISQQGKNFLLIKEDDHWIVNEKSADTDKVKDFLSQLLSEKDVELIAKTNTRHQEFEITEELGSLVTLDEKITFIIGKSIYPETYIRIKDSDEVYLSKTLSTSSFSTDENYWIDKTIVEIDVDKLTKMIFIQKGIPVALIKTDNEWKIEPEMGKPDQKVLDEILTTLSSLEANSIANDEQKASFSKAISLTLTIEFDKKSEVLTFQKGDKEYLVNRGSDGETFIVNETSLSSLIEAPQNL